MAFHSFGGVLNDANLRIELKRLADQAADRGDEQLLAILGSAIGTLDRRLLAAEAGMDGASQRPASGLVLKNVRLGTRRTTIRIETEFWEALEEISRREARSINDILEEILEVEQRGGNLTSAIRVIALRYFRTRTEP
jgi:predicted DNA-binding ribbon-helix-helix protein